MFFAVIAVPYWFIIIDAPRPQVVAHGASAAAVGGRIERGRLTWTGLAPSMTVIG